LFEWIGAEHPDLAEELAACLASPLFAQARSIGGQCVARGLERAAVQDCAVPVAEILGVVSQQLRRAWLGAWRQEWAQRAPRLASIDIEIRYEVSAEAYYPIVGAATLTSLEGRSMELYQLEPDPFFEQDGAATSELMCLRELTGNTLLDREALREFLYDLCDLALAQYRYDYRSTIELRTAAETVERLESRPRHLDERAARSPRESHGVHGRGV
jgi:hypothetical protein